VELVRDSFRDARIRTYVAIFVERESRLRLRNDLIPAPRQSPEQQPSAQDAGSAIALMG
jgi:hypothetical protein